MRRALVIALLAACTSETCPLPDVKDEGTDARCVAHASLEESAGACKLTIDVDFECDASTQRYDWTRIGWLRDGDVGGYVDVTYACGQRTSATFDVACDGACYGGGAVFDGPTDRGDVECVASI